MRKSILHITTILLICLVSLGVVSCKDSIINDSPIEQPTEETDSIHMPVLFSTSGEVVGQTRAGQIRLMPNNIRFSAMMFSKESKRSDYRYNHPSFANLLVEATNEGNCLYTKDTYVLPSSEKNENSDTYKYLDNYRNDKDADIFYWANRLDHAFIGYIDDYNKALAGAQLSDQANNTYKPTNLRNCWDISAPHTVPGDKHFIFTQADEISPIYRWQQYEEFSLENPVVSGTGDTKSFQWTKMEDMPDPLVAVTEVAPEGGTAEANRVHLVFRHQLAQVQVNLKGSDYGGPNLNKVNPLENDVISGVELWGVAEKVHVFPYPEYGYESADGAETGASIKMITQGTEKALLRKAEAEPIKLGDEKYNESIELNPYGSEFAMFQMIQESVPVGYLRSYEAISFGTIEAIRIHWKEYTDGSEYINHDITYKVTSADMKKLESGKRYIFNFELRRGTLAVIKAEVVDWIPYEEYGYVADGTIVK